MKYIIEFGNRGGYFASRPAPSRKQGALLAAKLINTFENRQVVHSIEIERVLIPPGPPRYVWQSQTHFVAVSALDGIPRGPAAPELWRKPHENF